jgi:hypothetical protein
VADVEPQEVEALIEGDDALWTARTPYSAAKQSAERLKAAAKPLGADEIIIVTNDDLPWADRLLAEDDVHVVRKADLGTYLATLRRPQNGT